MQVFKNLSKKVYKQWNEDMLRHSTRKTKITLELTVLFTLQFLKFRLQTGDITLRLVYWICKEKNLGLKTKLYSMQKGPGDFLQYAVCM